MIAQSGLERTMRILGASWRYASTAGIAGLSTLFILVGGCSLAPPHQPIAPDALMASTYKLDQQAAAKQAAQLDWHQFFGDPRLRELIGIALENNRNLRLTMQRVEEARALYGIQRSAELPHIGAEATDSRARTPADLSVTGHSTTASRYQVAFGLSSWELDFWGRVGNLKEAALESYLATDEARRAVQISLVAQLANAYLVRCELDERLDIAKQTLATREEAYRIMHRRFEVGAASKLDATQAELLLNQARAELAIVQRYREQSHNALTLLTGKPIDDAAQPLSGIEAGFAESVAPGLPSDLLINRPDILAAEHRLKAAHANVGAARAAFFPRITLTGNLGTASASLDGLFGADSKTWSFLPSISLPIFDAGLNQANLDLAEARRHAAVADYELTVQGAFREVADALADRRWLAEQVTVQQATLLVQTERARLSNLRYQSGAAAYLQVLDAERDRFAAEQALVQTRRALLASTVNLYAALGGGGPSEFRGNNNE